MKKGLKTTLIIAGSVAGALILTIVILSAIIVKPLGAFTELDYNVSVANTPTSSQNQAYENEIKDKLSTVNFSVMRSLLEFNADYSVKHTTKTVDGEDEYKTISAANFLSTSPRLSQFMLKISINSTTPQTNKKFKDECGNLIKFDTVLIIINESADGLQPVTIYPYLSGNLNNSMVDGDGNALDTADENGAINSAYYSVYEFTAKMHTAELYDFLVDKGFSTGTVNM